MFPPIVQVPKYITFYGFHAKNKSQEDVLQMPIDGSALKYIKEN
jgi:hypothetical protein